MFKVYANMVGQDVVLELEGEMTAADSSLLMTESKAFLGRAQNAVLDMRNLVYTASSGLRQIMMLHTAMKEKGGKVIIRHASEDILSILKGAGFENFIEIDKD